MIRATGETPPGKARTIDDERLAGLINTTLHTKPADGSTHWSVWAVAEEKLRDVVSFYLSPPEYALVLCVDEKSQCQAERTQRCCPWASDMPKA